MNPELVSLQGPGMDLPAEAWGCSWRCEQHPWPGRRPGRFFALGFDPARIAGEDLPGSEPREAWISRVQRALEAIGEGRLRKVVLARSVELSAPAGAAFDPVATARALRGAQGGCRTFLLYGSDGSALVGATPEELVRVRGHEIGVMALAGTAACPEEETGREEEQAGASAALLRSAKDRREHGFVVRALAEALGPLCVDLEIPEAPEVVRHGAILHLRSRISGRLRRRMSVLALARRLHPTPAVAGHPTAVALRWLRSHEPLDRGLYAGAIGWMEPSGDGVALVALRCARIAGRRARGFAGAGIVEGSHPEAEWEETELKLGAISRALRLRRVAAA